VQAHRSDRATQPAVGQVTQQRRFDGANTEIQASDTTVFHPFRRPAVGVVRQARGRAPNVVVAVAPLDDPTPSASGVLSGELRRRTTSARRLCSPPAYSVQAVLTSDDPHHLDTCQLTSSPSSGPVRCMSEGGVDLLHGAPGSHLGPPPGTPLATHRAGHDGPRLVTARCLPFPAGGQRSRRLRRAGAVGALTRKDWIEGAPSGPGTVGQGLVVMLRCRYRCE
jgi:hypothetical protein